MSAISEITIEAISNKMKINKSAQFSRDGLVSGIVQICALITLVMPALVWAHRGAENQIDPCQIQVGYEPIHMTAYTPVLTKARQYCQTIPGLGQTQLVFDYVGKKLKHITLEFEVTKEPEGKRVFYQEPIKNTTGTMNAAIDFSQYGAGDYKVRITIVHKGKRLDTYLPLQIGMDSGASVGMGLFLLLLALLAAAYYFIKYKGLLEQYFKDGQ